VEELLIKTQQGADEKRATGIMRLRGYLMDNCYGLRDYRLEVKGEGLRGLGVVEGNVDKLFADRMKKRGMSWTKEGANRMAKLISLSRSGRLDTGKKVSTDESHLTVSKEGNAIEKVEYDDGAWL
jgi:hypothetical protein